MPRLSIILASAMFVGAGTLHFVRADAFEAIVPDWVPGKRQANLVAGAAEIALGLGLLPRRSRRRAALGLAGLLVAVFPANVDMATNRVKLVADPDSPGERARSVGTADGPVRGLYWIRLPLQLPLIWWMWRIAQSADR